MWILILKNHFDSKKISFINCLHIPTKNSQNFSIQLQETTIYKRHCYTIYIYIARNIEVQRFTYKSEPSTKQIHHLRIFHETSRSNLSPTFMENRELIIDNETLTTDTCLLSLFQPFEWGEGGRGRECLDLGLRKDLPVTSTREFRAKYLFIRLWYA